MTAVQDLNFKPVITRHFIKGELGTFCDSPLSAHVVTHDVTRVTCAKCIDAIEVALERFGVDPYADKVGMFCVCLVGVHGVNFKYMARLDAVDSAGRLHFTAKDGSQKVFDRSSIVELDARAFLAVPKDQTTIPQFGGRQ